MDTAALLREAVDRVPETVRAALDGIDPEALTWRPGPDANTIAWLVWHLARGQDAQIADVAGTEQEWTSGGWAPRFGLDADEDRHGYGDAPDDVAEIRPESVTVLLDHLDAVTERTRAYLATVDDDALDRVVDDAWDPPVTLGARLVSIIDDDVQHAGQVAYVRGLWDRREA